MVCKGGLGGPCIRKFVHLACTGIYKLLGLCFYLGDVVWCLARCANLVRQLSSYPYSTWNRRAYKVKHIHENNVFVLHQQTPQPEIYTYTCTSRCKRNGHTFPMCFLHVKEKTNM